MIVTFSYINLGTTANDRTGDQPRPAGTKINANFSALQTLLQSGSAGQVLIKQANSPTASVAWGASPLDMMQYSAAP